MEETWTVLGVLQWTTDFFKRKGLDHSRADAEVLLAHVLGVERVQLYVHFDKPLNKSELAAYREAVRRRASREPTQYITGRQEFWSLDLEVNSSVLVPRPETELLVMRALELLESPSPRLLDLGTGSGAVAIALAHERPDIQVIAADISMRAIEVARRNAARHGTADRISYVASDLFGAFSESAQFDMIVSNPPYIGDDELLELPPEIAAHEPMGALKGGGIDGLGIIRSIIRAAPRFLKPRGWLLMEIGVGQAAVLRGELEVDDNYASFGFSEDYSGILRIASLRTAE